jgi:autoinducer 2-degrading protein
MSARGILVEFVVTPQDKARARKLILENATASLRDEAGCLRFDVLEEPADPSRFVLYEIYRSPGDFEIHLQSAHFKGFKEATRDLFVSRSVRELDLKTNEEGPASSQPSGGKT